MNLYFNWYVIIVKSIFILYFGFQIVIGINGFGQGFIYSALPSQLFALWEARPKLRGPVTQACYAIYSAGCVISPYIALPFLVELPKNCRTSNNDVERNVVATNTSIMTDELCTGGKLDLNQTMHSMRVCEIDVSNVRRAFHIIGIGSLLTAIAFVLMFFMTGPSIKAKTYCKIYKNKDRSLPKHTQSISKSFHYSLLSALTVFYYFFVCYLYLPLVLIAAFVITGLGLDVSEGSLQTSVFTGAIGIGRLLSIPLTYYISPNIMIPLLTLISMASFITLAFSQTLNQIIIRICIIAAGLGSSSLHSFTLLWLSPYVPITSSIGALLMMSSSVAGFTAGGLVGYLMEINHLWFAYVCIFSSAMTLVCFFLMNMIVKICHVNSAKSFEQKEIEKCLDID